MELDANQTLRVHEGVASAVARGEPVVALESTLIVHRLPQPDNLRVAAELEAIVREEGATPATIGVVGGVPPVGLEPAQIAHLAEGLTEVARLGVRGKAITPFVLDYFHRVTGGQSLRVNTVLVRHNARLAARIACALARRSTPDSVS